MLLRIAEKFICESEEATNSEVIAPMRAPPQSRSGTCALASLVNRDFKELLLQWRKRSGQWHVATISKRDFESWVNLKSNDRHARANRIRQTHRFDNQARIIRARS